MCTALEIIVLDGVSSGYIHTEHIVNEAFSKQFIEYLMTACGSQVTATCITINTELKIPACELTYFYTPST